MKTFAFVVTGHRARLGVFLCGRFAVPLLERVGFAPLLLVDSKTD